MSLRECLPNEKEWNENVKIGEFFIKAIFFVFIFLLGSGSYCFCFFGSLIAFFILSDVD